jgi:hypothetical protein
MEGDFLNLPLDTGSTVTAVNQGESEEDDVSPVSDHSPDTLGRRTSDDDQRKRKRPRTDSNARDANGVRLVSIDGASTVELPQKRIQSVQADH